MKTVINLPVLEGEILEVEVKGFSSKSKVFLNGDWQREESSDSGVYQIKLESGTKLKVIVEQDYLDFSPRVLVEGQNYSLIKHSSILSKIATCTPTILGILLYIFTNIPYFIVAVFCFATLYINSRVLRLKNKSLTKILTLSITNAIAIIVWLKILV